ncbi:MAG: hypothetical protein ACJA0U_002772 [Salibacteraceae bacterium]
MGFAQTNWRRVDYTDFDKEVKFELLMQSLLRQARLNLWEVHNTLIMFGSFQFPPVYEMTQNRETKLCIEKQKPEFKKMLSLNYFLYGGYCLYIVYANT